MSEFAAPILISFVISLLVSFILLSITILLSSKIDKIILLSFFFVAFVYGFLYIIPFPLELFAAKQRLLLILGGSSSIFFLILAKTFQSKLILLTSFFFSTFYVCLCIGKTNLAFINLLGYLTVFFFPIDFVFFSLVLLRTFSFAEWGFALFMQLAFLFALKRSPVNYTLFLYFLSFWVFTLLIPEDPIFIVKYFLCPFSGSGALAIFFLYLARSGKEHLVTYLLYFSNGLLLCFLFKNTEAAYYFIFLNLFFLFILAYMTYIKIDIQNNRFSKFPSEFLSFVFSVKEQYLLKYYGIILLLITFYSDSESWLNHWAFSLILQVGLIQF